MKKSEHLELTSGVGREGGLEPPMHCWSRDMRTVVSYLPPTLHHPSLPTINCDWPTLARVSHVRNKGGKERAQTHI